VHPGPFFSFFFVLSLTLVEHVHGDAGYRAWLLPFEGPLVGPFPLAFLPESAQAGALLSRTRPVDLAWRTVYGFGMRYFHWRLFRLFSLSSPRLTAGSSIGENFYSGYFLIPCFAFWIFSSFLFLPPSHSAGLFFSVTTANSCLSPFLRPLCLGIYYLPFTFDGEIWIWRYLPLFLFGICFQLFSCSLDEMSPNCVSGHESPSCFFPFFLEVSHVLLFFPNPPPFPLSTFRSYIARLILSEIPNNPPLVPNQMAALSPYRGRFVIRSALVEYCLSIPCKWKIFVHSSRDGVLSPRPKFPLRLITCAAIGPQRLPWQPKNSPPFFRSRLRRSYSHCTPLALVTAEPLA